MEEQDIFLKLKMDMCNVINNNPLPISAKYFIIKDLFNEVENLYNVYVNNQMQVSEEKTETKTIDIPIDNSELIKEIQEKKKKDS